MLTRADIPPLPDSVKPYYATAKNLPPDHFLYDDPRLMNDGGWLGWFENGRKKLMRRLGSLFQEHGHHNLWRRTLDPVSFDDFLAFENQT